ncbi:MAG: VOC family protein [Alphaproteobacteria bacterium]|nr:VOC family protein [Alphaproteobacteria bacterium]
MSGAIGGFDHIIIGVADLDAARGAYRRLGFTVSARGRHIGWGTANYCIMFAGDYLELLGIIDPAQFTNNLDTRLAEKGEGLLGVSFAAQDADAAYAQLSALGAEPPKDLKRLLDLPEGPVEPAFRLVHLPAESTPGTSAFLTQHLSRDLVWQPDWLDHANGARRVVAVTVRAQDIGCAAAAYGNIFGPGAVSDADGKIRVRLDGGELRVIAAGPGEPEGPAGLDIAVDDIGRTAAVLEHGEIAHQRMAGRITITPDNACGVALAFVED